MLRTPDHLYEALCLLAGLLPAVAEAPAVVREALPALQQGEGGGAGASGAPGASGAAAAAGSAARARYLAEHGEVTRQLCNEVLPLLLQLLSATVLVQVGRG